mgnify:CR=1 FL=1
MKWIESNHNWVLAFWTRDRSHQLYETCVIFIGCYKVDCTLQMHIWTCIPDDNHIERDERLLGMSLVNVFHLQTPPTSPQPPPPIADSPYTTTNANTYNHCCCYCRCCCCCCCYNFYHSAIVFIYLLYLFL